MAGKRVQHKLVEGRVIFIPIDYLDQNMGPLDQTSWVAGMIIIPGIVFYLATDSRILETRQDFALDDFRPDMFNWTTDAEFWRGRWQVGEQICPINFPVHRPENKGGDGHGGMVVRSFEGEYLRPYDPIRDKDMNYATSCSPILVEKAVQGLHGVLEWQDYLGKYFWPPKTGPL